MTPILKVVQHGGAENASFHCPGCGHPHSITVGPSVAPPRWGWNGSHDKPTFTPSIFVKTVRITGANREAYDALSTPEEIRASVEDPRFRWWCHSFVVDGRIQYLGDSSHSLAGQTVDLPPWPHPVFPTA